VSTPNTPLPHPPPESETAEVPTAQAELQIVLLPTSIENRNSDPAGGTGGTTGQIMRFTAVVILVTGTLFGARLAHLGPVITTVAVLTELVTALGLARFRRISRHK